VLGRLPRAFACFLDRRRSMRCSWFTQFHNVASEEYLWLPLCSPNWKIPQGYFFSPLVSILKTTERLINRKHIDWVRHALDLYFQRRLYLTTRWRKGKNTETRARDSTYDYLFKMQMVGKSGVGKTHSSCASQKTGIT